MKKKRVLFAIFTLLSLSSASTIEKYYASIFGENQLKAVQSCSETDDQCELILDPSNGYLSYTISELATNQKVLAIFKTANKEDRIAVGIYSYPEYGPSYMHRSLKRYPYSRFRMLRISESGFDTLKVVPELHPADYGISGEWIEVSSSPKVYRDPENLVEIQFQEEIPQYGTTLKIHLIALPGNRIEEYYRSINSGKAPSEEVKSEINRMKSLIDGIYSKLPNTYIECRWDREMERFFKK